MKKQLLTIAILSATTLGFGAPTAHARVDLDMHIGAPPPPPPPRHHRRPYFHRRPDFLYTPRLGFSVSVGGTYDMIYYSDRYYIYDDGSWYWSRAYDGPWYFIEHRRLPKKIRRFRREEIRHHRDVEYRRRYHDRRDQRDWRDRDNRRERDRWH